ncbi:MAG: polyprenyl synthetase family protein [Candidatus Marinimicrobia bacterium]|nr:polyprenyl synthetase family protein [Candidatus Neomarinimicrobiota bacterium]
MTAALRDIQALRERIDQRLKTLYPEGPASLTAPVEYVSLGKGKRLRPLLTLITARACGGTVEDALPAAIAVEALHNFTLVHDDIMDHDELRHGQPSVHARWGDSSAILTGDVLFVLALKELRKSPAQVDRLTEAFAQGALAVCEGQALDLEFESRADVSLKDYMEMIDLKTGQMLGLAARLGAISGGGTAESIAGAGHFGLLLGRAFQIQDDLLELISDAGTMGKSLGSDLVSGKKTYLYLVAFQQAPDEVAAAVSAAGKNIETGVNLFRELLVKTGAREKAERLIRETVDSAVAALEPFGSGKADLLAFADIVLNRKN